MSGSNQIKELLADQSLCEGIQKNPQWLPLLVVDGKPMAAADCVALLQARIDSVQRAAQAKTVWLGAVKAARDAREKSQAVVTALRLAIQAGFFDSAEMLGEYGLKPRKRQAVSAQTRVVAAAKAKATRAARHTMGSKQKKAVKGAVDVAVVVTPSAASQPNASVGRASPSTPAGHAPASATPAESASGGNGPAGDATPRAT